MPGAPNALGEVAGKAIAAVKGQVGTARAAVTEQAETHLRNAQEELREEHVEMALYTRLEVLANEVGDRESAQLARAIRRDEERMAKYLDTELQRLVKDVVRAEIPTDQRAARRSRSRRASGSQAKSSGRGSRAKSSARGAKRSSSRSAGRRRAKSKSSSRKSRSRR